MDPNAPPSGTWTGDGGGFLDRFLNSSVSIYLGIEEKVRNLLNKQEETEANPETESASDRELQSTRIQLHLLSRDGRFEDVCEMAATSQSDEIVLLAVSELKYAEDDAVKLLTSLAQGYSRATVPAIAALLDCEARQAAEMIFTRRLGELLTLLRDGMAEPLSILDIAGRLEFSDSDSMQLFESILQCLASSPLEQTKLFGKILGDPDPTADKDLAVANSVNREIKLRVVRSLSNCHPLDEERFLWFATRCEEDTVASEATVRLISRWQSNVGKVPFGLEPFPMLDINLLFYLCQLSASFKWRETSGVDTLCEQNAKANKRLKTLNEKEDKEEFDQLTSEVEETGMELYRITERRVNLLQPLLNKVSEALDLPYAVLGSTDNRDVSAWYLVGRGRVEINWGVLLEDKPLSEEVMSSLLHEMGHFEQDVLMIRMIADDLGIKFGQHRHLLMPLWDRYSHCIGYAPDHMFLLGVLRVRADRPLTEIQRRRAERLFNSAYQKNVADARFDALGDQLDAVAKSYNALLAGDYDANLLQCFRDQGTLDKLVRQGRVPTVLLGEVNSCRLRIEGVVHSLVDSRSGEQKVDVFALAQNFYNSKSNDQIVALVNRLKELLLQILDEEYDELKEAMSDNRKGGYHEDECYTISDRVEVIVKALRKEWYRLQ